MRAWYIFLIFLRLGLTSFGGPVAHIGYFREEFVERRRWLNDQEYSDLVALCQFLPGPASSQVGIAIGLLQQRYLGALAAWLGFTLPSAIALLIFAAGLAHYSDILSQEAIHGLKIITAAVVIQAIWAMSRQFCRNIKCLVIMLLSAISIILIPSTGMPVAVILLSGLTGVIFFQTSPVQTSSSLQVNISCRSGIAWLVAFFSSLLILPIVSFFWPAMAIDMMNVFYRAGALVFGGGHVVLPMLHTEVVSTGWVDNHSFIAGYGAAQAVPGPLFTFASFLGASMSNTNGSSHIIGAIIATISIFMPSFFLVAGSLPFWQQLRSHPRINVAFIAINAAVVGILLAALYDPILTHSVRSVQDITTLILVLALIMYCKVPPWLMVVTVGLLAAILHFV